MADVSHKSAHNEAGGRAKGAPTMQIGRYESPVRGSEFRNFISNIRDFLTERPVNVKGVKPSSIRQPGFGESMRRQLERIFPLGPRGR